MLIPLKSFNEMNILGILMDFLILTISKKKFDIEVLPNEDSGHFQTMGGFITSYFGYIPEVGEKIIWHKFRFEIISMDKARIDRILVTTNK